MGLAGEYELNGEILVVDNLREALKVGEKQVGTLVGGEATGKADDEGVGVDFVDNFHHGRGITLVGEPFLLEIALHEVDELVLHRAAHVPDFLVLYLEDTFPVFGVVGVLEHSRTEFLPIELLPLRGGPGGHVNAVGNVAHVAFLPVVALPDTGEHLLRHLAVEPAYAVGFLAGVESEHAHREALVGVGVLAAHVHQVVPGDAEFLGVFTHIFAEETFVEIVVAGRHGGMDGIEA